MWSPGSWECSPGSLKLSPGSLKWSPLVPCYVYQLPPGNQKCSSGSQKCSPGSQINYLKYIKKIKYSRVLKVFVHPISSTGQEYVQAMVRYRSWLGAGHSQVQAKVRHRPNLGTGQGKVHLKNRFRPCFLTESSPENENVDVFQKLGTRKPKGVQCSPSRILLVHKPRTL